MTKEEAIEIMKTSTTINEWNDNRDKVMNQCTKSEWKAISVEIDAYGLVVEVLGRD
jgi:hypothetical protein